MHLVCVQRRKVGAACDGRELDDGGVADDDSGFAESSGEFGPGLTKWSSASLKTS